MTLEEDTIRSEMIRERVLNVENAWGRRKEMKPKVGFAKEKEQFRKPEKNVMKFIKANNPAPKKVKAYRSIGFGLTRR